ncbi:hypothetical protein EAG_11354, partial [Camponotus floridanus]
KGMIFVSCYCSPNESMQVFDQMLDEIRFVVTQEKNNIVICGDFNAKSYLWSSGSEDARGKSLVETTDTLDLRLVNEGNTATCVRTQGSSIVDTTWSTADIFMNIQNWRVEEDEISL